MENYRDKLATGVIIFLILIIGAGCFLGKMLTSFIPEEENPPTVDYDDEGEI